MPKYVIDANLPYYFGLWNSSSYIHVKDIKDEWTDTQIWKFAPSQVPLPGFEQPGLAFTGSA